MLFFWPDATLEAGGSKTCAGIINSDAHVAGFKLRDDFAAAIPAVTIAAILGISQSDIPLFTSLAYRVSKVSRAHGSLRMFQRWKRPRVDSYPIAKTFMVDRRRKPKDDFLSQYVASVDGNADLSPTEAVMQLVSVVLGARIRHVPPLSSRPVCCLKGRIFGKRFGTTTA